MESLLEDIRSQVDLKLTKEYKGAVIDVAKTIKSNDKTFNLKVLPKVTPKIMKCVNEYIDLTHEVEADEKAYLTVLEKVAAIEDREDEEDGEFIDEEEFIKELETLAEQEKEPLAHKEQEAVGEVEAVILPEKPPAPQEPQREAQKLKDPITKQDIRVPVQSSKCKHVYEKETIEKYLETSKKCPQAGCTNKRMMTRELIPFNPQESSPIIIS